MRMRYTALGVPPGPQRPRPHFHPPHIPLPHPGRAQSRPGHPPSLRHMCPQSLRHKFPLGRRRMQLLRPPPSRRLPQLRYPPGSRPGHQPSRQQLTRPDPPHSRQPQHRLSASAQTPKGPRLAARLRSNLARTHAAARLGNSPSIMTPGRQTRACAAPATANVSQQKHLRP
jgi:hypothetical protein